MPSEGIRQSGVVAGAADEFHIVVQGRTVRIHLAGILDRARAQRLVRAAAAVLVDRDLLVILDGSRLVHLDYRCVPALVRWSKGLRSYGQRVVLAGWNDYLRAILTMEDSDGELEGESRGAPRRRARGLLRHVQVP
ncbi:MAG TPA: STAS domain-containing protein [Candidatus Krumholzibacteria bacterium]|nr:STAS domain-containing protein [Candidatus Krumholzibacteria bacterium]HPD72776.1 STAS domain-containing protein [Candidatus Krumholzibacteria bacterium]HRY40292.1 STAS domain-containing protein [Candidatus Krumholzibacteria bacterium]